MTQEPLNLDSIPKIPDSIKIKPQEKTTLRKNEIQLAKYKSLRLLPSTNLASFLALQYKLKNKDKIKMEVKLKHQFLKKREILTNNKLLA